MSTIFSLEEVGLRLTPSPTFQGSYQRQYKQLRIVILRLDNKRCLNSKRSNMQEESHL